MIKLLFLLHSEKCFDIKFINWFKANYETIKFSHFLHWAYVNVFFLKIINWLSVITHSHKNEGSKRKWVCCVPFMVWPQVIFSTYQEIKVWKKLKLNIQLVTVLFLHWTPIFYNIKLQELFWYCFKLILTGQQSTLLRERNTFKFLGISLLKEKLHVYIATSFGTNMKQYLKMS